MKPTWCTATQWGLSNVVLTVGYIFLLQQLWRAFPQGAITAVHWPELAAAVDCSKAMGESCLWQQFCFWGCVYWLFFKSVDQNVASPVEMSEYEPKQKKMTSQAKESFAPLLASSECKLDTKPEIAKLCLTQVLFCQLETATVTATGTLLLCIIQPARGLCSWADLLALTAGCEREEPEEDGNSNGQRCRRISTNQ
jgi:hypothetical protein